MSIAVALLTLPTPTVSLHVSVTRGDRATGTHDAMSNNKPHPNEAAAANGFPVPQPMTPEDHARMMAEADERWANRPRPIARENEDPDLRFAEPLVCRLPNGGVSDNVRKQLERNRERREAEARAKAAQEQHEEL